MQTVKKRFSGTAITGLMLVIGLIVTGCATTGGTGYSGPPDGAYHNYSRGDIVFDAANGSWEAAGMGYKGSFSFNRETSGISLTATQALQGLRWENIEPIRGYAEGRVNGSVVDLGAFQFIAVPE
jgi:hypothetical protein